MIGHPKGQSLIVMRTVLEKLNHENNPEFRIMSYQPEHHPFRNLLHLK